MLKPVVVAIGFAVLAGCGDPKVEIVVPLAIVSVSPHDGATGIDRDAVPTVCFNRDMDAAKASGNLLLEDDKGGVVTSQPVTTGSARCLSVTHDPLQADTTYILHAKQGLGAADATLLSADARSQFRTAK